MSTALVMESNLTMKIQIWCSLKETFHSLVDVYKSMSHRTDHFSLICQLKMFMAWSF